MDANRIPTTPRLMPNALRRAARFIWDNIGFICIGIVFAFCVVHAFDPPRLNWGDSGSDYNVMGAGRAFQTYGFLKLRLTSFILDPSVMTTKDSQVFIYTHYPQLPELMNGILRVVFRLNDLVQFRFVALAFSFSALFFIYNLISGFWSPRTAQIAIALWVMNPLWIQHADYLHEEPYATFFGYGCLFFLVRYLRDERRRSQLAVAGAFLFLTYLASYNWWFFGPLLVLMVTVGHYGAHLDRRMIRVLGILASCAAAAVLFKMSVNAWGLQGVPEFLKDLRFQFAERATDSVTRTGYRAGIWPTLYGRVERFFTLLLFPAAAFWAVYPTVERRWGNRLPTTMRAVANPLLLLIAALPFLMLFVELWVAQYYPTLLVLPFYAVGFAAIATMFYDSAPRAAKLAAVALVATLLANSVDEVVNFKAAFFPRNEIASLGRVLDRLSPIDKKILVDHNFDGQYRFYFKRMIVSVVLMPPGVSDVALASLANPRRSPTVSTDEGAVFVHHKHMLDEMYDKGYYYILGRYRMWWMWGNPRKYRDLIDSVMASRDSILMANVAKVSRKEAETDFYTVWRVLPRRDSIKP